MLGTDAKDVKTTVIRLSHANDVILLSCHNISDIIGVIIIIVAVMAIIRTMRNLNAQRKTSNCFSLLPSVTALEANLMAVLSIPRFDSDVVNPDKLKIRAYFPNSVGPNTLAINMVVKNPTMITTICGIMDITTSLIPCFDSPIILFNGDI